MIRAGGTWHNGIMLGRTKHRVMCARHKNAQSQICRNKVMKFTETCWMTPHISCHQIKIANNKLIDSLVDYGINTMKLIIRI
jgi:hypothetical protein